MSAAAPWSVKGIDPKAREVAKDLARRSGMTLGEWLNSMIMDDEEEGYATLPRRSAGHDAYDRRSRSRRLDDAYDADDSLHRISASIDVIASRLEAAERRSTLAIQGVDQAVAGLVRRLDGQEAEGKAQAERLDEIAEELREGHRRLRAFERDTGPKTQEGFGKVEASLGALAGRLYDIEERQRLSVTDLRDRMDAAEKAAGPGAGTDVLAQVGARLDEAQSRTSEALRGLERSFAELDRRMRAAEGRIEPEGVRDAARFEKLAESLSRQIDSNRAEMIQRLDAAEVGARIDRIERAVQSVGEQVKSAEQKGVLGIEAMGREVLRIAQNLSGRLNAVETGENDRAEASARTAAARLNQEFARHVERVDQRLTAADDRNALALEKLGGEITRISDRLSDRIAQSERRSQQALEDIGRRLAESTDKIEQRYDRASGELAERMRLSEERTARLLADARDSLQSRGPSEAAAPRVVAERAASAPRAASPAFAMPEAPAQTDAAQGDWRAAAFPQDSFDAETWSSDPVTPEAEGASPFPTALFDETATASVAEAAFVVERTVDETPVIQPFSGFGGADVDDALEALSSDKDAHGAAKTPTSRPALDDEAGDFDGETDFVDPRRLQAQMGAAAAAGRAPSTRGAIDAARAAIASAAEAEEPARGAFGLKTKRGGKSKLQERLDRQAARESSTVKKAFLASVTAVALTGGVYGYAELSDGTDLPHFDLSQWGGQAKPALSAKPTAPAAGLPIAASAVVTDAIPPLNLAGPGAAEYEQAVGRLESGDNGGVELLKRAADLGYAPAQTYLGQLYLAGGNGLNANPAESRQWGRRAAQGGDPRGMHLYGMQLFEGDGGPTNQTEALTWLKRAAERGLPDSQYNVARIYETGADGVAKNSAEALKWYMIAARAGDSEAQAAVTRLRPTTNAVDQRAARTAADAFVAQNRASSTAAR
ncbi:hypothetical protein [Brevundimonas sp. SORGH_AS_0993]|uniref:SEL1-like repeat protein n=1 Tax=Brevundimonas sp. SORGH_AS_0993 TaxID=3041794 RepID=UPI0027844062|nr:hypothetical protein [Brevundimonas sp. SORGH_AS_0993]MDQ1154504.1 localization factor PodJL [Brevundimonas sp. SORGH_AS_0993]